MLDRILTLTDYTRRDNRWLFTLLGVAVAVVAGWLVGTMGIVGGLLVVVLPVVVVVLLGILTEPRFGLFVYVNLSFGIGFTRLTQTDLPVGLSLDGVLMLTLLSVFLNGKRMNWHRLRHPVFYLVTVWLCFTILAYFNPESPYPPAWFFHARFFSLNLFYIVLIVLVTPITRDDIRLFIKIWLCWSFLAALWAFKQQYIGLEPGEQRWLDEGGEKTHVLWGQLRSFSFYSDASQFGAEMAGVTLICLIRFFEDKKLLHRLGYLALAGVFFWGFAVSGTRSALFVIVAGYPAYLVLLRKPMPILWGAAVAIPIIGILYFTTIGDSVYHIYRMRTALRPTQDASFLLRLENQRKLRTMLKDLPFGAGIGSSSDTGARFSPDYPLSVVAPDSWYVEVWIETGVVGLTLYLLMLTGITLVGTHNVWQLKDPWLQKVLIAFLAEFIGICLMSYSNPTLGQFPTSTVLFISCVLFTTGKRWDIPLTVDKPAPQPPLYETV